MIPSPPLFSDLRENTKLIAGLGVSTVIADMDFETYSPAGYVWNEEEQKWDCPEGATKKGLMYVGAAKYTEHPEAEVICLAYDLKDGKGPRSWLPHCGYYPTDLFEHLNRGKLIEAWNCAFERWVWKNICEVKYDFPPLPFHQLRDAMAKSRANALPGGLDDCSVVLKLNRKDPRGKALIQRFSIPQKPSKKDLRKRILVQEDPLNAQAFYEYNIQDIKVEAEISSKIPDLNEEELEFWIRDQAINLRGVQIDVEGVHSCITIIEQTIKKYTDKLPALTNGYVTSANQAAKIRHWAYDIYNIHMVNVKKETVEELLKDKTIPDILRSVLEIRSFISSNAVKKLYALKHQVTNDGRLHDVLIYHGARTGRATGQGPQPQNIPSKGPKINVCPICSKSSLSGSECPWCGYEEFTIPLHPKFLKKKWNLSAVEDALEVIKTRDLNSIEYFYTNAIPVVSGCLRSLFISAPGHDLICSDYSAIEAVVLAAIAKEEWRLEVFRTHGKIYEASASKITKIPFDEFELHEATTGEPHPARTLGKIAELAAGYQGYTGAWAQAGADKFMSAEEIEKNAKSWRNENPRICKLWYGLSDAANDAVMNPGKEFNYGGFIYVCHLDTLYCRLLSGRYLTYHKPRLEPNTRTGKGLSLSFEGWNTNQKYGAVGWVRMSTYGGKLTENIVQATARDILANAIINLEENEYPVVLHVHDEIVSEVQNSKGSIEQFEKIMNLMPFWAKDWPIKAKGGWRGKRYRK